MGFRRIAVFTLAMLACTAPFAAAGQGSRGEAASRTVPSAERTNPQVRPAIGGRYTDFLLDFTLREAPGHAGFYSVSYRIQVTPPRGSKQVCTPDWTPSVLTGEAGTHKRVRLRPPARGWCPGLHRVTVFLERGPYCGPPIERRATIVCPEFATEELSTGTTSFAVRAPMHHPHP